MSYTGLQLSDLTNLITEVVRDEIEKWFRDWPIFDTDVFPVRNAETINDILIRVKTKRSTAMKYLGEPTAATVPVTMPEGGEAEYVRKAIELKWLLVPFTIDLLTVTTLLKGDKSIDVNVIEDSINDLRGYFTKQMSRAYMEDGNGKLATVPSGAATVTGDGSTEYTVIVDSTEYIEPGQKFDTYTGASKDVDSNTVVKVPTDATFTVVLTSGKDIVAGDTIHLEDAYGNDWKGLAALIGTGDLYGLTAADYKWWQSLVENSDTTPSNFDLDKCRMFLLKLERRNGGRPVDFAYMHPDIYDAVEKVVLGKGQVTYESPGGKEIVVEPSGITIKGTRFRRHYSVPTGAIYFFPRGAIKRYRYVDFEPATLLNGNEWEMGQDSSGNSLGKWTRWWQHIGDLVIEDRYATGSYPNLNAFSDGTY